MLPKMTAVSIFSAALTVATLNFAIAETAKGEMTKKKIADVTCEDFNGVSASFQPTMIAWAEGFRQGSSKPDDVVLNIDGLEKVTPLVVEACQNDPKASFWSKAEAELKKIF